MNLSDLQSHFGSSRPKSAAFFEQAASLIAGGVNGNLRYYQPFPLVFQQGRGAWLTDADGKTYVDYLLSYGALLLGHGHPVIREAVETVWEEQGTSSFGATHPLELDMCSEINQLYPSMESIRFTNSGLEATLFALRLALAYTGKTHIAKFSGHYHGSHDHVLISVNQTKESGPAMPKAVPDSKGLPDYYVEHTVVLPFHDWEACEKILTEKRDEIGAVILEPLQSGYISADQPFMENLRSLTEHLGIVLIFDEVKTGFRITLGGAQTYYGVKPDLTALGKVVGGGFPIGVVGGKRAIMEMCSPLRSSSKAEVVFHSGTFNGNPISLAAGLATIRYLKQPGRFDSIVDRTTSLRKGIETLAREYRIPFSTVGAGTIFNLVPTEEANDAGTNPQELRLALDYLLMDEGIYTKPLNRFSMSDAHGETELQATLQAFEKSFQALRQIAAV
ncbi:aspartate aminotransferase family protein [Brevibacillus sp. B_LB10_24]|uniref:aspartate aminotransferase family protein n=1 Tax=Brevibacillus sp. B_LB10_24 TaxID=3380645 RepID=UPI0038B7877A